MSEYVIQSGDTLSGIAARHGIRYWPNIYFARENVAFMNAHPNPDFIRSGDRVFIPSRTTIAPMERTARITHRLSRLFTQSSETCWRAAAKMLYCHQHGGENAAAEFDAAIGTAYATRESALRGAEQHGFYCGRLGMRSTQIQCINDLHAVIAARPAIVHFGDTQGAHAMVMVGYELRRGQWFVLDPTTGQEEYTFEEDGNAATYSTRAATWENLFRTLWIFEHTLISEIYHY